MTYGNYISYSFVISSTCCVNYKINKDTFERHTIGKIFKYIIVYYIYKIYNIKDNLVLIGLVNINS